MGQARAAIGFAVKSGWASAVLLVGPVSSPRVVDSRRVELSDPAIPESRQPYHAGFGTARAADAKLSQLIADVRRFGRRSVSSVIRQYQSAEPALGGVAIVVGSLIDPDTIRNDHIRIHAREGQLFRGVVQDAAARSQLPCEIWRERDLHAMGTGVLRKPERTVRETLTALGRDVGGPWRAEQKAAALAAWLVLAKPHRASAPARMEPRS